MMHQGNGVSYGEAVSVNSLNGAGLRIRNGKVTNSEVNGHAKQNGKEHTAQDIGKRKLPEIEFIARESLLTQMFEVQEFRGLYNLFLVILINLTAFTILDGLVQIGSFDLGWRNIQVCFGKPFKTASLVIGMHIFGLVFVYPTFLLWVNLRRHLGARPLVDLAVTSWTAVLASGFIYIPIKVHWDDPLPVASSAIVVLEQLRILMKMYAFLRTNCARQLVKTEKEESLPEIPSYSQYAYFFYAPTLVYRDSYPRSKDIRWGFILRNAIELIGCIFVYNILHSICGYVMLENLGKHGKSMGASQLIKIVFFQMIPGGVGFLLGFFTLLHTSQNIGAELLRFGDRQFYKDWWNSSSFSSFYRNWNLPVHHFLYTYIYRDANELGFRSKLVPTIGVFLVSAIVHEYILIFVLRFFYPVLLLFFGGFGLTLNFIHTSESSGNTFIWWSLITGKGLILFFYSAEYFARLNNCPAANSDIVDFLIPRSWTCGVFSWEAPA